jgi:hypothetical protein
VLASTAPLKTTPVVLGMPTNGNVVAAIAAAFIAMNKQAFGAAANVADHEIVQVVVPAAPMVMLPAWFVLPATTAPFVVVPQAPDAIVGRPAFVVICPVAERAVKAPAAGAVPPIGGGEANWAVTPAPDGALVEVSVVKLPGAGVVAPIVVLSINAGDGVAWFGGQNGKVMLPFLLVRKMVLQALAGAANIATDEAASMPATSAREMMILNMVRAPWGFRF